MVEVSLASDKLLIGLLRFPSAVIIKARLLSLLEPGKRIRVLFNSGVWKSFNLSKYPCVNQYLVENQKYSKKDCIWYNLLGKF